MRKLNEILLYIFLILFPPIACFLMILSAYDFYVLLEDELAALWLNIGCLFATVFLAGFFFNMFILSPIMWIKEKIHFYRLDKFYKEHPEKEKENAEALARDFEKLAEILRNGKENEEDHES